ncbi:AP2-like ethylene-responsive transcription factor [Iris pallida]|uniref:AP2-like ethylene-responsive transcription factor n=1 Tax=Iris pallida TaxID=29817 RepID=A0AAX6G6K9_IRIPA|nr:AP2-like ethylene-responsive transcription factor [Iris pallida]
MLGSMDAAAEGKYAAGGFSMERKIDLTPYIKWWMPKKSCPSESEEDFRRELRALECTSVQPTEPYQLPSLGLPQKGSQPPPEDCPQAASCQSSWPSRTLWTSFQKRMGLVGIKVSSMERLCFLCCLKEVPDLISTDQLELRWD